MTRFHLEKGKKYRSITFLCQHCHGELELTGEQFAGDSVWVCRSCQARWIYMLAGWGRIPGYGAQSMTIGANG